VFTLNPQCLVVLALDAMPMWEVSQNINSLYAPLYFVLLSVNSTYAYCTLHEIKSDHDRVEGEVDVHTFYAQEAGEVVPSEPAVQKAVVPLAPPKGTDIQLSKEFQEKTYRWELGAVLVEVRISHKSCGWYSRWNKW
jgi:hypothetical protein